MSEQTSQTPTNTHRAPTIPENQTSNTNATNATTQVEKMSPYKEELIKQANQLFDRLLTSLKPFYKD